MNADDYLNESLECTSQRERVERLRSLKRSGEQYNARVNNVVDKLRDDIILACKTAEGRIQRARDVRDMLPSVKRELAQAVQVWRIMRLGHSRDVAGRLIRDANNERFASIMANLFENADAIQAFVDGVDAESEATASRAKSAQHAIDVVRQAARKLERDDGEG